MKMLRSGFLVLLLAVTSALCGCGSSFNQAWKTATAAPIPANSMEGPWIGSWLSKGNGHHGELRCVIQPDTKGNGDRTFLYHTIWGGVLSGNFVSIHHVKQNGP
ncbi:MAG: hypothetical protein JWO08_1323, partial [Verrucomicrobiaceae bacterium]|nr:hypothetical protein [Verrucomicrobiaceae bacterium]